MEFSQPPRSGDTASGISSRKSPEADHSTLKPESGGPTLGLSRPHIPPSERSDSYFSTAIPIDIDDEAISQKDEDVELKRPLTMENKVEDEQDNQFLNQLDARLLAEAQRPRAESKSEGAGGAGWARTDGGSGGNAGGGFGKGLDDEVDDGGPRLKLKKSMNFGSAFGSKKCGNI